MHSDIIALCLLAIFFATVRSDVHFHDCGSQFRIERVAVMGCEHDPCFIRRGTNQHIEVAFQNVPTIDAMNTKAFLTMFGNRFALEVKAAEPCTATKCPHYRGDILGAVYEMEVYFPQNLISRPGELFINTTYVSNGNVRVGICFEVEVDILRL